MSTQPLNAATQALEQQLQQKLNEYAAAEAKGKSRDELNAIYKNIKDIRYKLTLNTVPGLKKAIDK